MKIKALNLRNTIQVVKKKTRFCLFLFFIKEVENCNMILRCSKYGKYSSLDREILLILKFLVMIHA